jgi:hypothetical protein
MNNARTLLNSDLCPRRAWYSLRWSPPCLSAKEILYRSVEFGLQSTDDAGEAAETHALDLAVDPGIDTNETDLLALANHIGALANFTAWVLRGSQGPWERPQPVILPDGSPWESGAFLSASQRGLRRVVLVDRWDAWAQMALERSWDVAGECSVYEVGMDCIIVDIGAMRQGRWSNPFTTGYRHPVAKTLRFRKRDGDDFGSNWDKVWRDADWATRDEWLNALADDGALTDVVQVHSVEVPVRAGELCNIAQSKMGSIRDSACAPEESPSMCFDRVHPCPFRSVCPRGLEPSEERGFTSCSALPRSEDHWPKPLPLSAKAPK